MKGGEFIVSEGAGDISVRGTVIPDGSGISVGEYISKQRFRIASDHRLEDRDGHPLTWGIFPKQEISEYGVYALTDASGDPLTDFVIRKTAECQPLTFTDFDGFDITGLKVGREWRGEYVSGGVSGGVQPYTAKVEGLPEGLKMSALERGFSIKLSGTPTAECPAGEITVTVRDSSPVPQEASIRIRYDAVTADPVPLIVNGTEYDARGDCGAEAEHWSWEAASATLTLSGYSGSPIRSDTKQMTVVLKGANTITMPAVTEAGTSVYGLRADGNLIIRAADSTAADSLTVRQTAFESDSYFYGISAVNSSVSIESGSVNVELAMAAGCTLGKHIFGILGSVTVESDAVLQVTVDGGKGAGYGVYGLTFNSSADCSITAAGGGADSHAVGSMRMNGSGSVDLTCTDGFALRSGYFRVSEGAGDVSVRGIVALNINGIASGDFIRNRGSEIAADHRVEDRDGHPLTWGFLPKTDISGRDGYALTDSDGNFLTDFVVRKTSETQPLVFVDYGGFDLKGLKVDTYWGIEYIGGAVSGGVQPYSTKVEGLPAGMKANCQSSPFDIQLTGTPTEECEAGDIRITVRDSSPTPQEVSILVHYDAVTLRNPVSDVVLKGADLLTEIVEGEPVRYLVLEPSGTAQLTSRVSPDDASNPHVAWLSGDEQIAAFQNAESSGVNGSVTVKGRGAGCTAVSVRTDSGGKTDSCLVYVREAKPAASVSGAWLTGLAANGSYRINGTPFTADGKGRIAILPAWFGTSVEIVHAHAIERCCSQSQTLAIGAAAAPELQVLKDGDRISWNLHAGSLGGTPISVIVAWYGEGGQLCGLDVTVFTEAESYVSRSNLFTESAARARVFVLNGSSAPILGAWSGE